MGPRGPAVGGTGGATSAPGHRRRRSRSGDRFARRHASGIAEISLQGVSGPVRWRVRTRASSRDEWWPWRGLRGSGLTAASSQAGVGVRWLCGTELRGTARLTDGRVGFLGISGARRCHWFERRSSDTSARAAMADGGARLRWELAGERVRAQREREREGGLTGSRREVAAGSGRACRSETRRRSLAGQRRKTRSGRCRGAVLAHVARWRGRGGLGGSRGLVDGARRWRSSLLRQGHGGVGTRARGGTEEER
jgi:hypothetical protein